MTTQRLPRTPSRTDRRLPARAPALSLALLAAGTLSTGTVAALHHNGPVTRTASPRPAAPPRGPQVTASSTALATVSTRSVVVASSRSTAATPSV